MKSIDRDYTTISDTDLAYAAGILDGEGCILIVPLRYKGRWKWGFNLMVRVSMTDPKVVPWLHATFGGGYRIYKHKHCPLPQHCWSLYSRASARFLQAVRPWLKCKAPQADLALEFQATAVGRGQRVGDRVRGERTLMYEKMRALKKVSISA